MPKPVAEVGEGHKDARGNGVYCFIRDLIVEGRDARFVDKKGRYEINWSRALECYHDYKSKRNPQYNSHNISRRKASNGLRGALLNYYKKEGAKEYRDCKKVNEKDEVVERQFQMPPRLLESLFGSDAQLSDSSECETSSVVSEADEKPLATANLNDIGFDEAMDISDDLFNANEEPNSHCALGGLPAGDPFCSNAKTEEDQVDPSDITTPCQVDTSGISGSGISGSDPDATQEDSSRQWLQDVENLQISINPKESPLEGGAPCLFSFNPTLHSEVTSGHATFKNLATVPLERLSNGSLHGFIPASPQPGLVSVTLTSQHGIDLGQTNIKYYGRREVLKKIVRSPFLVKERCEEYSMVYGFGEPDETDMEAINSRILDLTNEKEDGLDKRNDSKETGYLGDADSSSFSEASAPQSSDSEDDISARTKPKAMATTMTTRKGTIMVPGRGIAVAQQGVITNSAVSSASIVGHPGVIGGKAITTASDHQSLGKTVFHVAQGQGARHTGLPMVPLMNMIVQPQLNIASATTQQFQKQGVITTEKSTGLRDQDTQTETTETFQHVTPSRTMLQHGGKNYPVEYLKKTLALEDVRLKSPDQSRQSHEEKTNTSWVMKKGAGLNTADEGLHPHFSRVSSDYESQVSDQTDSGIEITDNSGGSKLPLLLDVVEIISAFRERKSIVEEIIPKQSSIRGGDMFILILKDDLPSNTDEGYYAKFGFSTPVVLTKINQVNLKGTIPAYHSPGVVSVEVVSSTGHLGQTEFTYTDAVDGILMTP